MKRLIIALLFYSSLFPVFAQNWDVIRTSGDYFYGEGLGATEDEAGKVALDNLLQMIAVNVSSDFTSIYDGTNTNGQLDYKEQVTQVVKTYSQSSLSNVQTWTVSSAPNAIVRKFMLRAELDKMYDARKRRLQDMVRLADQSIAKGNVDVALQYYYWAYSLVRSLQFPAEVKDETGLPYLETLPNIIRQILRDVKVEFVDRDEDFVELHFTYQGRPATVDFTYNDGRKNDCEGKADGGNACIEMASGFGELGVYHINIEYEYRNFARGDAEVHSVLEVIPRRSFGEEIVVKAGKMTVKPKPKPVIEPKLPTAPQSDNHDVALYMTPMNSVLAALQSRHYEQVQSLFVGRGLDNYTKLISRRAGRVVGSPKITLYPGANNTVVARGLQMAFSVMERGQKTTLVDDVIFTFDQNHKICNLTLGIGSIAENDLLNKNVQWGEETRQQVLGFLENYKTAYCLKDSDYIKAIFDEYATIIVGHVAKRTTRPGYEETQMSDLGREIVTYARYTKATYLEHLKQTFKRNQFINIKFTNNDVMLLEGEEGKIFSIQIGQEYSSSTYADKGYLFLLVDMTNADEPLIKIRTWQPKPDPNFGIYGPGHFHK